MIPPPCLEPRLPDRIADGVLQLFVQGKPLCILGRYAEPLQLPMGLSPCEPNLARNGRCVGAVPKGAKRRTQELGGESEARFRTFPEFSPLEVPEDEGLAEAITAPSGLDPCLSLPLPRRSPPRAARLDARPLVPGPPSAPLRMTQ